MLVCMSTYGQETAMFDRSFHKKTDDPRSKNKREYTVTDSLITVKDYKKSRLYRTGEFYGFTDLENLDEFIWYNSNDQYDRNPNLRVTNRKGYVKYYNIKGNVTKEILYDEDKTKYLQVWYDSIPYLVEGTGKIELEFKSVNEKLVRIFKDSTETEGYLIRTLKKDTIHIKTDTDAYPKTGLRPFYQDLAENVKYPGFAQLLGIDKRITIEFIVDENGNLTDFKPLNKESLNFEKKAIRKLERMPKWIPATFNGKNVKTRFRIPLTFKFD